MRFRRTRGKFGDPVFLRQFHGWATIGWLLLIPITLLSTLKASILWIALMSAWANFASHWSAWQACRTEVKVDDATPPIGSG